MQGRDLVSVPSSTPYCVPGSNQVPGTYTQDMACADTLFQMPIVHHFVWNNNSPTHQYGIHTSYYISSTYQDLKLCGLQPLLSNSEFYI